MFIISHLTVKNSSEFSPLKVGDSTFAPFFLFFQGAKQLAGAISSVPNVFASFSSYPHRIMTDRLKPSSSDRSTCGDTFSFAKGERLI